MHSWEKIIEKVFKNFSKKGYNFNHTAQMNIITTADKIDMSYDFYTKDNMHAVERKLFTVINKNENLIKKNN